MDGGEENKSQNDKFEASPHTEPHIDYFDSQVLCQGKNLSFGFPLKSGPLMWLSQAR